VIYPEGIKGLSLGF